MRLVQPSVTFGQNPLPFWQPGAASAAGTAEVERVVVTGSNIPTAEETGPNPVDTYRPADLEKLGIRNAQDLETFLPQEAGGTVNLNIGNGGARHLRTYPLGRVPPGMLRVDQRKKGRVFLAEALLSTPASASLRSSVPCVAPPRAH